MLCICMARSLIEHGVAWGINVKISIRFLAKPMGQKWWTTTVFTFTIWWLMVRVRVSSSSKSSPKSTHSSPRQWAIKLSLRWNIKCIVRGIEIFYHCGRLKSIGMYNFALYMYGKKSYWTWCSLGNKRENLNQISC